MSLVSKPLSNHDLYNLFENRIRIITHLDLYNYDSLEELFDPYPVVFILYEFKKDFGHWCVLCLDEERDTVLFFDPYGIPPDEQFQYMPGQEGSFPYLSTLILLSPSAFEYNAHGFQDFEDSRVATCGRWCALFALLYRSLSLDAFMRLFEGVPDPDWMVSLLTHYV